MGVFFDDLASQADALRLVANFYLAGEGAHLLSLLPPLEAPVFTGMGSSFHAAWIATLRLQNKGFPVQLLEATHLLYACDRLIAEASPLVYVSQSGASEIGRAHV